MVDDNFRSRVCEIISQVPNGRVTTYGDVAALTGNPMASRIVGGIAHYSDTDLPWHRLVNRFGGLASGFPGGMVIQAQLLAQEGISCNNNIINDFKDIRWKPNI